MKTLFYNPIELPESIKIISNCFGVNTTYDVCDSKGMPVYLDELIALAKTRSFDEVKVLLTSHNDAYIKKSKNAIEGEAVSGWISLKGLSDGGGYLNDKCVVKIIRK